MITEGGKGQLEIKGDQIKIGKPHLTRYERARIVGARALQISMGAPVLIFLQNDSEPTQSIAQKEMEEKVLPISLKRSVPGGKYQIIRLQDLANIQALNEIEDRV